jgi:anti-sigma factor RsiW
MDCRLVRKHLSAYGDGELEPSPMLEVEEHLHGCSGCADEQHFMGALKLEIKTQLTAPPAPAQLRMRVQAALQSVPMESEERPSSHVWLTLATIAAAVVLVLGSLIGTDRPAPGMSIAGMLNPLDLARAVVDQHKDRLPAEISTPVPEQATSWFRDKVGFRVRSVEFAEPRVHLVGARMSQVGTNQAAKLYYRVGDSHDSQLTLVMFKASPTLEHLLSSQHALENAGVQHFWMSGREVPYRTLQGYTVPILQDNGIVYAFTGDLDQRKLLQLVATARIPH